MDIFNYSLPHAKCLEDCKWCRKGWIPPGMALRQKIFFLWKMSIRQSRSGHNFVGVFFK